MHANLNAKEKQNMQLGTRNGNKNMTRLSILSWDIVEVYLIQVSSTDVNVVKMTFYKGKLKMMELLEFQSHCLQ